MQAGIPEQPQQQYVIPPQQITGQPGIGQPAVAMSGGFPTTNATLALILAIVSIFFGGICLAIPAWIIANGALAIANSHPNHPDISKAKAAKIISVIVTILTVLGVILVGVLYVWANSLVNDNFGGDLNNSQYSATDHSDTISASTDNLIILTLDSGDDLSFALTEITLSTGENIYTCSLDSGSECTITQHSGANDGAWEQGENIVLSENTAEICSNSCDIDITVRYLSNLVSGPSSIIIS
jgi:hypothetical protein